MNFLEILTVVTIVSGLLSIAPLMCNSCTHNKLIEYARSFFPIFFMVLLLRAFIIEPYVIPSGSMKPTLLVGDRIIATKYNYGLHIPFVNKELYRFGEIKRGDIIIFYHALTKQNVIKRVIGLPGDKIIYKNKMLYINDKAIAQSFKSASNDAGYRTHEYNENLTEKSHTIWQYPEVNNSVHYNFANVMRVPKASYFVMGDNRDGSNDSRFWGFVERDVVLAKARAIAISWDFSLTPFKLDIRWDRIATNLY